MNNHSPMPIEPREIEAQLLLHPQVKEATVLVCEDEKGEQQLAAQVVADVPQDKLRKAPGNSGTAIIERWNRLYEVTYSSAPAAPSFVGWNSSYTRQPIPEEQMREWLRSTLERIRRLNPQKVLEIGCGVGLLLQHLAPQCVTYVGTDFSASALSQMQRWMGGKSDLEHVELLHRSATELQDMEPGRFDTVVLNSVVQYFPDIEYLLAVLQQAVRLVGPIGSIFIGDVRHFGLLTMFHSAVQLSKASDSITVGQLRRRILRAVAQETELAIDPQFFHELQERLPGISAVEVELKAGPGSNELTRYRYDVVLHVGGQLPTRLGYEPVIWGKSVASITELESALRDRRWSAARVSPIPNSRLAAEHVAQRLIETGEERLTAGALRQLLNEMQFETTDPERFWSLGESHGYDVSVGWCCDEFPECFEVKLLEHARKAQGRWVGSGPLNVPRSWDAYANNPRENRLRQQLVPALREYLQERLPEYLIPSDWTVLERRARAKGIWDSTAESP